MKNIVNSIFTKKIPYRRVSQTGHNIMLSYTRVHLYNNNYVTVVHVMCKVSHEIIDLPNCGGFVLSTLAPLALSKEVQQLLARSPITPCHTYAAMLYCYSFWLASWII